MKDERARPFQQIHFLEAWNAPDELFTDSELYRKTSVELVGALGLTIIGEPRVFPYPGMGFSFQTLLTESSFDGHTWQENDNYLNYLLHTCSKKDFSKATDIARDILQTDDVEFREITPHRRRMRRRPSGIVIPA
jgi:S-adenosylmethionine/arginine decarboxylase-like enzyme